MVLTKRSNYNHKPMTECRIGNTTLKIPTYLTEQAGFDHTGIMVEVPGKPGETTLMPYHRMGLIEGSHVPYPELAHIMFAAPPGFLASKHLMHHLELSEAHLLRFERLGSEICPRVVDFSELASFMRNRRTYAKPTGSSKAMGLVVIDDTQKRGVKLESEDKSMLRLLRKEFGKKRMVKAVVDSRFMHRLCDVMSKWMSKQANYFGMHDFVTDYLLERDKELALLGGKKVEFRVIVQKHDGRFVLEGMYAKVGKGKTTANICAGGNAADAIEVLQGLVDEHGLYGSEVTSAKNKIRELVRGVSERYIELIHSPSEFLAYYYDMSRHEVDLHVPPGRFDVLMMGYDIGFSISGRELIPTVIEFTPSSNMNISELHNVDPELMKGILDRNLNNLTRLYAMNEGALQMLGL
jgi:hypothetical protein